MGGETVELAELAGMRRAFYRYFAACFLYPTVERCRNLAEGAALLRAAPTEAFAFHNSWSALQALIEDCMDPVETETEFMALFAVTSDKAPCYPHESSYVAPPGTPTGYVIGGLAREYAELGIAMASGMAELPDHISVELEVLAHLCDEERAAWERQQTDEALEILLKERDFLATHPGRWMGELEASIERLAPGGFYATAASAAGAFISHEGDLLELLGSELPSDLRCPDSDGSSVAGDPG